MTYAPLFCRSNFSFLKGASHPAELVESAHRHGIESMALTDRDGVYGLVRAHVRARELGVHLILGSQVTIKDGSTITLLAKDREGFANLTRLITKGRRRCAKGKSEVHWREVFEHATGLFALWTHGPIEELKEAFGDRLYALIARHKHDDEVKREGELREEARRLGVPTVAVVEVLYHTAARRALQDVLTCIRHGVTLATAGRLTQPNAEHALKTPYAFKQLFFDDPQSVERTTEIAERCRFSLDQLR